MVLHEHTQSGENWNHLTETLPDDVTGWEGSAFTFQPHTGNKYPFSVSSVSRF